MPMNSSRRGFALFSLSPSLAWLTLFVPALAYFLISRIGSSWNRTLGPVASHSVRVYHDDGVDGQQQLKDVLYLLPASSIAVDDDDSSSKILLQHPLYLVQSNGLSDIVASCWKHDSDLSRGYLLLSESFGTGRIWRWEVGGGPISIGKTLYMSKSGCRSPKRNERHRGGSGPLAVDFFQRDHFSEGRLIVAEYGEERIVRVETDTGARTPLVLQVPDACSHDILWRRIDTPTHLIMTPFGDLLVLEQHNACHAIYRLKQAVLIEPLHDQMTSRRAHGWTNVTHADQLEVVYHHDSSSESIGSMALDETWTALYATVTRNNEVWLIRMSILDDDDDDDDDEENETASQQQQQQQHGLWNARAKLVSNLSKQLGITTPPRAMAVDKKGHVYLGGGAINEGVVILNAQTGERLGTLPVEASVTSLTLGEDGHLYVTTLSQLLRIRVKHGPVVIPTNMLPKAKPK